MPKYLLKKESQIKWSTLYRAWLKLKKINSSYRNYLKNENNNNKWSHDIIIAQVWTEHRTLSTFFWKAESVTNPQIHTPQSLFPCNFVAGGGGGGGMGEGAGVGKRIMFKNWVELIYITKQHISQSWLKRKTKHCFSVLFASHWHIHTGTRWYYVDWRVRGHISVRGHIGPGAHVLGPWTHRVDPESRKSQKDWRRRSWSSAYIHVHFTFT